MSKPLRPALKRRIVSASTNAFHSRALKPAALALWAVLLILLAPTPARAHGYLVRSIPEDRGVLERSPVRVQYWFSEALEPDFSSLTVRDQAGAVVAEGGVDANNNALMSARIPTQLPDGAYIVDLRLAFASDGHVIAESRVFFVGEQVGGVAGAAATDQAVPLEVVWRVLVLAPALLLLGITGLYSLVLVPAWGSPQHRAGLLPPRVMNRMNWIVIAALLAALAGNLLALLQQSMVFFGADAGRVLSEGLWSVVRVGTRFGDTWNVRMLLLVLVAILHGSSIYLRDQHPQTVRAFWAANAWALALVVGSFSVASHAAGSLLWPWLAVLSDWLHALAVGLWVGGVAALALIVPVALGPYEGEARRLALLAVLRRFSPLAGAMLVIVIATGIYNSLNWFYTPADAATTYGGALIFKLLLMALLVGVGALHHITLRPERYQRWTALTARAAHFVPTLRLEALLALAVVVGAALLTATPVPQPELAGRDLQPPSASVQIGDYVVSTSVTPGGPGVNTYDTVVLRGDQPAADLELTLRLINPTFDRRGAIHALEPIGDGLYVSAGDEIDRAGEWWTTVDLTDGDQTLRAAYVWQIDADAAVLTGRDPNLFNVLALAGVLAAGIYALLPSLKRLYRKLDLNPLIVAVAIGAVLAGIGITVVGLYLTSQTALQYEAAVNPPPQIINTRVPDQDSLARGGVLLAEACGGWAEQAEFTELVSRLGRTRDEELYAITEDGWRTLSACAPGLDSDQRWDIVNAVRGYERPASSS
jgi:putative copper export protein/methionine-rich copper-binding protein CopC